MINIVIRSTSCHGHSGAAGVAGAVVELGGAQVRQIRRYRYAASATTPSGRPASPPT
jgi:hypothetical protein